MMYWFLAHWEGIIKEEERQDLIILLKDGAQAFLIF